MATIVLAAAGCADLPAADTLEIGGQPYRVQWTQAPGRADVLLVLEPGFARRCSNLRTTARRPAEVGALVLCLDAPKAEAHACNENHSALPSLRAAGVDVVALGEGSTHLDAEAEDGDAVGRTACGTPQRAAVETLRTRVAKWLRDVAAQPPR